MNFVIAIHKDDGDKWISLVGRFPIEDEVLKGWYLIDVEAEDLAHAVRIAKVKRATIIAGSHYDLEEEEGE